MEGHVQNYDFGANWKTRIVPHLDSPAVQHAVRKCAERYIANFPQCTKVYRPGTPLACYSSTDWYLTVMERKSELYLIKNSSNLPARYMELDRDHDTDERADEWFALREHILAPLYDWNNIKHDIESYHIVGACHWCAPTVMLTLARLVEPAERWRVRMGQDHTTIVNREHTRVFDLVLWGIDGRIEHHLFGDALVEPRDPSLGGNLAYANSAPSNESRKRRHVEKE